MTGPPETLEFLDTDPRLRPLARAMAVRGPSWWAVLAMELRKTVDTWASRWVLAAVALLAVGAVAYELLDVRAAVAADPGWVTYPRYLDTAFDGVALLLPVVGVLAMTGEWSQRTALSTFTLVPRRGRVLAAKVVAAVLVVAAASLATAVVALAGTLLASWLADVPLVLEGGVDATSRTLAMMTLLALMASGLGALAGGTAAGVVALYALPLGYSIAAPRVLGEPAPWLDGYAAFGDLASGTVTSWPQVGTAVGVWVVLPLVLGVVRGLRREVA